MLRRIFSGAPKSDASQRTPSERMLTTRSYPLYYFAITKCGSTYLKNLLYALDHGDGHHDGDDVHRNDADFLRAGPDDTAKINASPYAFTVLRDPVQRFMSLYFDKIYGDGPNAFHDIRLKLAADIGLDMNRALDVSGHTENCLKFIQWLESNLNGETEYEVNPHWRRQSSRLQRVKTLDLTHLTLEGLDNQLEALLAPLVPDLRAVARKVVARNRTLRPVATSAVVTPELQARIHRVYASDLRNWEKARAYWQQRLHSVVPEVASATTGKRLKVLASARHPIHYLPTAKAGCTYVRNIFHNLDHGETYDSPLQIQTSDRLTSSYRTRAELAEGPSFFVMRDPFERFLSIYFDKVLGEGPTAFPWIRRRLEKGRGFHNGPDLTAEQHRFNLNRFLGYVEFRNARQSEVGMNGHWRPQIHVARTALAFGMKPLMLEELDRQLLSIAGPLEPALRAAMALRPERNAVPRPYASAELLGPRIRNRISALYAADIDLYDRVKTGWATDGKPPKIMLD